MNKSIFSVFFIFAGSLVYAQNVNDAVRYSFQDYAGTARHTAVGASMSALGGDLAAMSQNPAAIGLFRWSDLTLTGGLYSTDTKSTLGLEILKKNYSQFNVTNLGIVMVHRPIGSKWKTSNLGLSITQTNDFNTRFDFRGTSEGSLTYSLADKADGLSPDQLNDFDTRLAYETGAIYDFEGDNQYEYDLILANDREVQKEQLVTEKGHKKEFVIGVGANYDEKLMLGGSVSIPFVEFEQEKNYRESDQNDKVEFFNALRFEEYLNTSGSGLKASAGLIYVVNKYLRLGAAFHTPTRYRMSDVYFTTFIYDFTEDGERQEISRLSPSGNFNYRFISPWRAAASIGVIMGKRGFLSGDVEYVPYQKSKFRIGDDPTYERQLNQNIADQLSQGINIRGGSELAFGKFRIRGGLAFLSPVRKNGDSAKIYGSGGLGFRGNKFYIDLAYRIGTHQADYSPYQTGDIYPVVSQNRLNQLGLITLGFKY